jgi:uncharacterized membrane protein YhaH (DUF805 family)
VWSLVVPSVLYKIGEHLSDDTKTGLLLAVISLMPFALNAGGSFTLPNSLGFILFLPSLGLLLKRLENTERRWLYWLSAYGIFLVTGYTLYALIFFSAMGNC